MHPGIKLLEELAYTESLRFTRKKNVERVLEEFGSPQNKYKTIHVGGTNGKGSVSSMLSSMLVATGAVVGQFSSPHLERVTERCLINNKGIDENVFGDAVMRVIEKAKEVDLEIGYFSVCTIASFLVFKELNIDWGVVEVGLGGVHDATNVLAHPEVTVITGIDYDHEEILGPTISDIAKNKAGIFKNNVPAFCGVISADAEITLVQCAGHGNLRLYGRDYFYDRERQEVKYKNRIFSLRQFKNVLKADYQFYNASLAVCVAMEVGIKDDAIGEGLRDFKWAGRVEEFVYSGSRVILDAAHNPQGMRAFLSYVSDEVRSGGLQEIVFILSVLERKNWRDTIKEVKNFVKNNSNLKFNIILTKIDDYHKVDIDGMFGELSGFMNLNVFKVNSPKDGLTMALNLAGSNKDSLILVSGSIYLLGSIRPLL